MTGVKKLLIVESPTKARTIKGFVGNEYQILATVGHLRDLPKNKMGVEINGGVKVGYVIDKSKAKVVSQLKEAGRKAKLIMLATDPDREGEAIGWHVKWILTKASVKGRIKRMVFHEITRQAVEEAIRKAGSIDMGLVNAQQGRRVLDRVVGYSLSPLLWKKVRRGLSAGRVQSVAVRLICERERERESFKTERFYKVGAELKKGRRFGAELVRVGDKPFWQTKKIELFDGSFRVSKTVFDKETEAKNFVDKVGSKMKVVEVRGRQVERQPLPPFTTSKLQQTAASLWAWSGKLTMSVAQRLYERGLITYHRTDSVVLSDKAVADFTAYIKSKWGEEYAAEGRRVFTNRAKNAQEAHEAIRPTKAETVRPKGLDRRGQKLYELIWARAVASQARAARLRNTTILFDCGTGIFKSVGVQMLFDGFLRITKDKFVEQRLPQLKEGDWVQVVKKWFEEKQTSPPPRYNEASLVRSLEAQGIGRPSTYAPIVSTIQQRQYVEKEGGKFKPTNLGIGVNDFLVKNFAKIVSLPFTAAMEEDLDEIAGGKLDWQRMIKDFWRGFDKELKKVEKNSQRVKVKVEKLGKKCPECKKGDLVIRLGRFGKFVSCSRFPECKYSRALVEKAGFACPECGAQVVIKRTRKGRRFFGCSKYPKCKWASWKKP